jgi:hypothetical protein
MNVTGLRNELARLIRRMIQAEGKATHEIGVSIMRQRRART